MLILDRIISSGMIRASESSGSVLGARVPFYKRLVDAKEHEAREKRPRLSLDAMDTHRKNDGELFAGSKYTCERYRHSRGMTIARPSRTYFEPGSLHVRTLMR